MLNRVGPLVVIAALAACGDNHRAPLDGAPGDAAMIDTVDAYVNRCKVQDESPAPPVCDHAGVVGEFTPDLQWSWMGPTGFTRSIVTPLVANLTDDNGDGAIDLCDTPDVVVVASPQSGQTGAPGRIFILDGKTGTQEVEIPRTVDGTVTPALGDLDHDGVPDIVTVDTGGRIIVFDHTGATIAGPGDAWPGSHDEASLALADIDHDGEVEILGGASVFEHTGVLRWTAPAALLSASAPVAADLDGDGDPEILFGPAAYHADGTLYWDTGLGAGFPQVANLDGDPEPEVLLTNFNGISLIDHDGHVQYSDQRTTPGIHGVNAWIRPATIADFNGDGVAEFAMCSQLNFSLFRTTDATPTWNAPVSDQTGIAGATAFDLLGTGKQLSIFADEQTLWVFDSTGQVLYHLPRTSGTLSEYPVVADIDNDGAAEILVTSNTYPGMPMTPTVRALRDRLDRWMPARRIWNQHTYHVTNVNEDGTIPAHEAPWWRGRNTFRANAELRGGRVCQPPPIE